MAPPVIRAARRRDIGRLREIEVRAGELFREVGMDLVADDEPLSVTILRTYVDDGRAFVGVVADDVVGYVLIDVIDKAAHVEQLSVDPEHGRRGLGTALLDHVELWSTARGLTRITLITFVDVRWNRPYYERRGYRPLRDDEVTPGLAKLRRREAAIGLDAWPRVCMARDT